MENAKREEIVTELKKAYSAELETVQNYLANSIDLDGVRAEEIKKSLGADIQEELGHAMMLAKRIKVLGGRVPGSMELTRDQNYLQPPKDSTDLINVIKGVITAEDSAIAGYERIIALCDRVDPVTQDLAINLLGDEQEHRRAFLGYLTEFERR
jgi:bacterioferritin